MISIFGLRRPGPTDLSWEDENPVAYVYRASVFSGGETEASDDEREGRGALQVHLTPSNDEQRKG
jgi:hypothetical protein